LIGKFVKKTTATTIFLVAIILISSSSMSISLNNLSEKEKLDLRLFKGEKESLVNQLTGLDPDNRLKNPNFTKKLTENYVKRTDNSIITKLMYGFVAYGGPGGEGPCYFPLDDPGNITILATYETPYFMSGGTWTCDSRWLCSEYNSGDLWELDPDDGSMANIGGGGTPCNGLAWDPVYNRLYGASSAHLIEYDPETGEQDIIGSFGLSGKTIIAIAINWDGRAFIWDVLFTDSSTLWEVDLETGEATEIGSMNQNLNYAQDGAFDWETGILYLTAYSSSGFLATCDIKTGELTKIGDFEGDAEITASMIPSTGIVEHDVELKSINSPESGYALPEIPMQVTVKNRGNNTEIIDLKMQLDKFEEGPVLFEEDFSDPFPPEGWTTDFWNKSFTNWAGGESPEAIVYKYWQTEGGQYYDNFIMTPPIDATGWEKILINFRWGFQQYSNYGRYCNFYVKYRKNDTSPWMDVTPWDNPLNDDYEGDLYTIDCYGYSGDMGDGFQVLFQYIGYYHYYNYFYLDDIAITAYNSVEEYNETVEDIELYPGEEKIVDFPTWSPPNWQNPDYEDTWQDFFVKAWSLLEDDRPYNDYKEKIIDLYYPWMHDVELTSIDSPCKDGPGKIYPVQATIKNVGQYAECCIPINLTIGEQIVLDTLFTEDAWDTVPPVGWYDEHKDFDPDYGWQKSNTSLSGGNPPESRLRYYKALSDHVLYSYAINTSIYSSCRLEFKSYINHFSGSGLYALEAGYSYDGETWYAVWHEEPESDKQFNVECAFEGGFETTYIGFWVTGNPYYFNYWYIDDISVSVLDSVTEYSEFACKSDDLEPGESITFEFDDWTPEFLQYETTDSKDYIVHAEIHMFGDKNPDNDVKTIYFNLDYWHDPALEMVSSPTIGGRDLLWENGDPDGRDGKAGSVYYGNENLIVDDLDLDAESTAQGGHISLVWNSGSGTGNLDTLYMWFFEETGDCEPSLEEYEKVEVTDFTETLTGDYYFSRPEVEITVEFDDVDIPAGVSWVGFQPDSIGEDIAYLLTAENKGCEVMADLPYWGVPRWTPGSQQWGDTYDLAWQLTGYSTGPPSIDVYIQPGTKSIDAVAINHGTFQELDLICDAEIWEYIFHPYNGTIVYEDNISNIDLDEPVGGTVDLKFDDFTFGYEGRYGLYLSMPGQEGRDDFPKNNHIRFGIGVDDTKPVSSHKLNPRDPDGQNGWYVNDLEVTLYAEDPWSMDVTSGIKEIRYRINYGPIKILTGGSGKFHLTQEHDGDDVEVEYWAIDNVGNIEDSHKFYIDMDQTEPSLNLMYEVIGGNPIVGWTILITAMGDDVTSGKWYGLC
jgi:hypothetical protein